MSQLKILVKKPTESELKNFKVFSWDIWTKEPSSFDWHYDEQEVCFFLEGEVVVQTPDETVSFGKEI